MERIKTYGLPSHKISAYHIAWIDGLTVETGDKIQDFEILDERRGDKRTGFNTIFTGKMTEALRIKGSMIPEFEKFLNEAGIGLKNDEWRIIETSYAPTGTILTQDKLRRLFNVLEYELKFNVH